MKLSNKEKILLSLLSGVFVGLVYYQFIYSKQIDNIEGLKEEKLKIETRYNEVINMINSLEERKEKVGSLTSSINFKTKEFYPKILQEKLILDLDNFLKQSIVKGDIGFSEIAIQSVEILSKDKKETESTFKPIVDEYNSASSNSNVEEINKQASDDKIEVSQSSATVEILKANINFKATYESLKSFISKIEISNRQIVITDISTTVGYNGELTGTMNLEFYGIPKISERDNEYLQWNMNGSYGKEIPFLIQKPEVISQQSSDNESLSNISQNNNTTSNANTQQNEKSDFDVIVKSITSDLPTVIIGKNDKEDTYINTVKNNKEEAEIELKKVDGKYYYKYKYLDSSKSYPADYNGKGMEFSPISESIIISINSEARVNADDKSELQLNIVNGTDKIVQVNITGDDKTNPRVTVAGNSNKVKVTRK